MITDKETNKPRGYAFIEYAHTRDMKSVLLLPLIFVTIGRNILMSVSLVNIGHIMQLHTSKLMAGSWIIEESLLMLSEVELYQIGGLEGWVVD